MLSDSPPRSDFRQIQVVISSDPLGLIPAFRQTILNGYSGRLTTQIWQTLPSHDDLLNDVLTQMANLALAIWPAWYSGLLPPAKLKHRNIEQLLARDAAELQLQQKIPRLSVTWLKKAASCVASGSLPLIRSFSRTVQCEQLAMALGLDHGIVLLALTSSNQDEDRLRSLAQVCSWLAETAKARIALVIPPELAVSSALDSITYQAEDLTSLVNPASIAVAPDEETFKLWPIHGQPHPCSPGEQLLAARLAVDEELAGLFNFNLLVRTVLGTCYLVDLLWAEGRLVVEVDGYRHHSSPAAFCQDRQRDYELLISDYLVLRLPHSDVMEETEKAIVKLRQTVGFRRQQLAAVMSSMP